MFKRIAGTHAKPIITTMYVMKLRFQLHCVFLSSDQTEITTPAMTQIPTSIPNRAETKSPPLRRTLKAPSDRKITVSTADLVIGLSIEAQLKHDSSIRRTLRITGRQVG